MKKKSFHNRLNNLDPKAWLQFQKSWFIHNPPPRKKGVLCHPAKFPETLVQTFIEFFTKAGDTVLDPMAGTGSTLVACLQSGRNGIGIELSEKYAAIAREAVAAEQATLGSAAIGLSALVIHADCRAAFRRSLPPIDYIITSPPYWDMLHMHGASTQKNRRADPDLDVFYSDDPRDLGNLQDYDQFLAEICDIYASLRPLMKERAYLTVIVKNIKKRGRIYPLAWDLARGLSESFTLKDERIWCQENQRLAPYGMGAAWVSNTFHHYCLQFRKES
jgi:DNA modification methylase